MHHLFSSFRSFLPLMKSNNAELVWHAAQYSESSICYILPPGLLTVHYLTHTPSRLYKGTVHKEHNIVFSHVCLLWYYENDFCGYVIAEEAITVEEREELLFLLVGAHLTEPCGAVTLIQLLLWESGALCVVVMCADRISSSRSRLPSAVLDEKMRMLSAVCCVRWLNGASEILHLWNICLDSDNLWFRFIFCYEYSK